MHMGSKQLGSKPSTPAIQILGVNRRTRSVIFQQGDNVFTASQRLGWLLSHENPSFLEKVPTPRRCKPLKRFEIPRTLLFREPQNGLKRKFATRQDMTAAEKIPAAMKTALEEMMGPLKINKEARKRALTISAA